MQLKNRSTILFQGDSITDVGRDRDDNSSLGFGYAMMTAAFLNAKYPEMNLKFYNRGIGGDRVINLKKRWQKDCIDLKPDIVSIYVGINDTWRRYDSNIIETADEFKNIYKDIILQVKNKLDAEIILIEPFVLPVTEEQKEWREDLDPKIHVIRELAREFNTGYIPLDGIFSKASAAREMIFWTSDGVHPSDAGHALIAREWLKLVDEI